MYCSATPNRWLVTVRAREVRVAPLGQVSPHSNGYTGLYSHYEDSHIRF